MAYMNKDGEGPFPNKAGEYCGNHFVGSAPTMGLHQDPKEAEKRQKEYLLKFRFGRPRPCAASTTIEMESKGFVGLYLKEDSPLETGCTEVEMPDELKEPSSITIEDIRRMLSIERSKYSDMMLEKFPPQLSEIIPVASNNKLFKE